MCRVCAASSGPKERRQVLFLVCGEDTVWMGSEGSSPEEKAVRESYSKETKGPKPLGSQHFQQFRVLVPTQSHTQTLKISGKGYKVFLQSETSSDI